MSQIASGYAVTSELLDRLAAFIRQNDYNSFWSTLRAEAAATEPAYPYSGTVVSTLIELLQERGWTPVIDANSTSATTIADSDIGLVICCDHNQADEGLASLRSISLTDAELAAFHSEFWGEEWDEAVLGLRQAISFIERTLGLAGQRGDWALLFIG